MPSTYAHYRMGVALLPTMPADVRRTIGRFRRLFDVGLHGPDIFFYHNPILPTSTGTLGAKFHARPAKTFSSEYAGLPDWKNPKQHRLTSTVRCATMRWILSAILMWWSKLPPALRFIRKLRQNSTAFCWIPTAKYRRNHRI